MRFTLNFPSFFTNIGHILAVIMISGYLASCSSSPTSSTNKAIKQTPQQAVKRSTQSAEQLVKQAKAADTEQANNLLIQASQQYLIENSPEKSLWLSEQLATLEQTPAEQYTLALTAAQANLSLNEIERSQTQLQYCEQLAELHGIKHNFDFYNTWYQVDTLRSQAVTALNAYLHAFALNTAASEEDINYIWQNISHFSLWQQEQLAKLQAPLVDGWVALTQLTNQYGGSASFSTQLSVWQKNHPSHPANSIVTLLKAQEQQSAIQNNMITHVAIILPLSGKQAAAGKSAQQGILAAYAENPYTTLHFIDSNGLDFLTLPQTLTSLTASHVIGPLLKENVEQYLAIPELNLPTLVLNIPDNLILQPQQMALSMRPEDEAQQAASVLSQKQFKHPVVLSHQDNVSLRIAKAFVQKWHSLTGESPDIVNFEQGKKMQEMLKQTLSVDKSQNRINALRSRLRQAIKTEARSRRDIDMIYIVGNPQQTRLLKPYIDVNISPFADIIPVFSSSRSHSINTDQSTINDLRGLTFTQMPWLLNSSQQNKKLANTSKQLWPKRSDSLQRIFAMGYDSLHLLAKLPQMQQHHFIRYYGQTGILKLGEDNIITRSLLWGTYKRTKVAEIAME